jgi:microbial collagenase
MHTAKSISSSMLAGFFFIGIIVAAGFADGPAPCASLLSNQNYALPAIGKSAFPIPHGFLETTPEQARVEQLKNGLGKRAATYTYSQLNAMTYSALVAAIKTIAWSDITDLWTYSNAAYTFWNDDARVQALIDALREGGETFSATDAKGIPTLGEVLRAGLYLAFYNTPLNRLNTWAYHAKLLPALEAIANNPHCTLGNSVQLSVTEEMGAVIGSGIASAVLVNRCTAILKQFNDSAGAWMSEESTLGWSRRNAAYKAGSGLQYALGNFYIYNQGPAISSPFYNTMNAFFSECRRLALFGTINQNVFMINNAVWWVYSMRDYAPSPQAQSMITDVLELYPQYSQPWVTAVQYLAEAYSGIDSNGKSYDLASIKKKLFQKLCPRIYSFDNNTFRVMAGDSVDSIKIRRLYWGHKEVKAQFHRLVGMDQPLESGHVDDTLRAIIYNSPDDYKNNLFLFGLATDNGGMYIEGSGTFYTYERTTAQSIYTLEDLFRHELTHYLQGRYLVPGLWGATALYANDRLTWFEEGNAEFMAGSSREHGVTTRKRMVQNISSSLGSRMTLTEVLHANYGSGFTFYTYAFGLWDYLYKNRRDIIAQLIALVQANNVTGYDALIASLSGDAALSAAYASHLSTLVAGVNTLVNPSTSDDYVASIQYKSLSALTAEIAGASGITGATSAVLSGANFKTYILAGTYTGATSGGAQADWEAMNTTADSFIATLTGEAWNGYKTTTAHFVNYRLDGSNHFQYDLVFTGKTNLYSGVNSLPVAEAHGPYTGETHTIPVTFSSAGSGDPDGWIQSYLWNFGDGGVSSEANPEHLYTTSGSFTVSLTVTDDHNATTADSATVTINPFPLPWKHQDIGSPTAGNAAWKAPDSFIVGGGGWIFYNDACHFVYQEISGDCAISAKIASVSSPQYWSRSGVMIREALTDKARQTMAFTAIDHTGMSYRDTVGVSNKEQNNSGDNGAPAWLKVQRNGNTLSCFKSSNGSAWTQIGASRTIPMSANVYIGLAGSAYNDGLDTTKFTNVTVTGAPVIAANPATRPSSPAARIAYSNCTRTLTFRYTLAKAGVVRITLYSIKGEVIQSHATDCRPAGSHTVTLNLRSGAITTAGGVYLYQLKSGSYTLAGRIHALR